MEIDLRGNIRQGFCRQQDCPLQAAFADGMQKQEREEGVSFNEAKDVLLSHQLQPANDFYGSALPEDLRQDVGEKVIFTADCTQGHIEETNYTNCGSAIINLPETEHLTFPEYLAAKVIEVNWVLNNT